MAYYQTAAIIPRLDSRQILNLNMGPRAVLMTDLTMLQITHDDLLTDLLCFSSPDIPRVRELWTEASSVVRTTWQFLEPLIAELKRLRVKGRINKPVAPNRYLDRTRVTYEDLQRTLEVSCDYLQRKLREFYAGGKSYFLIGSPRLSRRPLPEIVLEAILLTYQPQSNRPLIIGQWLDSPCQIRQGLANPRYAHLNGARMSRSAWQSHYNLNPAGGLRVGFVKCISAACIRRTLYTGSTLVNWGEELGKLLIGFQYEGVDVTLHWWFKLIRQSRFNEKQQRCVNAYVGAFIRHFKNEVESKMGKTLEELFAMKNNLEKANEIKKLQKTVRPEVLDSLNKTYLSTLPDIISGRYVDTVQGQSYKGQSWEIKPKCPACESIYPFRTSSHHDRERTQLEYDSVGELDRKKSSDFCGVCAEALVFMATVWALKLEVSLCKHFGVT